MSCPHCPVPAGLVCRGLDVPRFCELVDPEHLAHDPRYIRILVADDVQVAPDLARVDAAYAEHGTGPARGGCCH